MSIGRITMIEFTSDEALKAAQKLYLATQKEYFPNAQVVINVKTGPLSVMSLAIYESYEEAEKTLSEHFFISDERPKEPPMINEIDLLVC